MYTNHTSSPLQPPPWLPKSFQEDRSKEKKGSAGMRAKLLQLCPTVCSLCPTRLLCPWDSPGKNARTGCHALLQGIFLTQGLNPCLLHCRQIFCPLSHLSKKGRAPFKEPYFPLKWWRLDTGSYTGLEGSRNFMNLLWDFGILVGKEFTFK